MSSAHRRYFVLEQGVGPALFNLVLNAAIAWLMFRGAPAVPLWGEQSIVGDTLGTCFFLPFITGLVVTRVARGHVRTGRVAPLGGLPEAVCPTWLPAGTAARAALLGVVCIVVVGLPVVGAFAALGIGGLGLRSFIGFKAGFAAALAAIVTPLLALWAINGPPATLHAAEDAR